MPENGYITNFHESKNLFKEFFRKEEIACWTFSSREIPFSET